MYRNPFSNAARGSASVHLYRKSNRNGLEMNFVVHFSKLHGKWSPAKAIGSQKLSFGYDSVIWCLRVPVDAHSMRCTLPASSFCARGPCIWIFCCPAWHAFLRLIMWWGARKNVPNSQIFYKHLARLCVGCARGTGMPFMASPISTWQLFFYQVQKYSKLLTNGPSTCRDITQNSAFEKSKIAYNCIYIVNLRFLIFRFPQIYNVNAVISDFRVSESAILGDVSARWRTVRQEFWMFLNLVEK